MTRELKDDRTRLFRKAEATDAVRGMRITSTGGVVVTLHQMEPDAAEMLVDWLHANIGREGER